MYLLFYRDLNGLDLYKSFDSLILYSKNSPKLYYDDYIYIMGSPEPIIWNADGSKEGAICVVPRNRAFGSAQTTEGGALKSNTDRIKTSLNSIRSMTLRVCDKDGNLIQFDEEFALHVCISFDID